MKRATYISLFVLSFFSGGGLFPLFSQELPSIQTDRPDQTECPFIVPKNYFQVESGFVYERSRNGSRQFSHPGVLAKYGLNSRLEFRYETELSSYNDSGRQGFGVNPQTIGFKVKMCDEKGIIPLTSFIAHLDLPGLASPEFRTPWFAPSFRFTMQHTLSQRLILAYNLGAEWQGGNPDPVFLYTLTTGLSLTEKAGAYAELYGFARQGEAQDHRCDGGFTYLISDDVMVDASGGLGFSKVSPRLYLSLGFSFRIRNGIRFSKPPTK